MLTTPNSTSADTKPGAETKVRGEGYAHAVMDDEGSPALPIEERPLSLAENIRELIDAAVRSVRTRPAVAMAIALGAGYVVGRLRARS
jgi:hypothetical protein